jgi:hypothetical protein
MRTASSESSVRHHSAHPPADRQRGAADQRHGADGDPGLVRIQAHHAGGEKHRVLPVRPAAQRGGDIPAVGVRALHEPQARVGEVPGGGGQPAAPDLVVGVHHGDQLRPRAGVPQRPVQRARLSPGEPLHMQEPEPRPEPLTMRLDRLPQLGVGGVVVDDQHLEVGIIQSGQVVQRADHQVRRLGVAGHMHRHPRRIPAGPGGRRPAGPAPAAAQQRLPALPGLHHRAGQGDRRQHRGRPQQRQRHRAHIQPGQKQDPPAQQGGAEQQPARPRRRAHRMQPPAGEPIPASDDHRHLSGPHRGGHVPSHQPGINRAPAAGPAHDGQHRERRASVRPPSQAGHRHHMHHGENDQGGTQVAQHPAQPSGSAPPAPQSQKRPRRRGRYRAPPAGRLGAHAATSASGN